MTRLFTEEKLLDAIHDAIDGGQDIRGLAEDLGIKLRPRELKFEALMYASIEEDSLIFYDRIHHVADTWDKLKSTFGSGWGCTRVEVTIREVV